MCGRVLPALAPSRPGPPRGHLLSAGGPASSAVLCVRSAGQARADLTNVPAGGSAGSQVNTFQLLPRDWLPWSRSRPTQPDLEPPQDLAPSKHREAWGQRGLLGCVEASSLSPGPQRVAQGLRGRQTAQ